jgi:uncharacterized membrane protein
MKARSTVNLKLKETKENKYINCSLQTGLQESTSFFSESVLWDLAQANRVPALCPKCHLK